MHPQMNASRIRKEESSRPPKDVATVLPSNLKVLAPSLSITFPRHFQFCSLDTWSKTVMQLLHTLVVPVLPIMFFPLLAVAAPFPDHAMVVFSLNTQARPIVRFERRALVYGLPPGWTAVFQTVTSIQPPLISPAFIQFFSTAANLAAADPVSGRRVQRIPFGALVLEFIADNSQDQVVTKEFVVAASLWLLDAAQKGWTGFFKAWVIDRTDGEIVFVRLTNAWDGLTSLTY